MTRTPLVYTPCLGRPRLLYLSNAAFFALGVGLRLKLAAATPER